MAAVLVRLTVLAVLLRDGRTAVMAQYAAVAAAQVLDAAQPDSLRRGRHHPAVQPGALPHLPPLHLGPGGRGRGRGLRESPATAAAAAMCRDQRGGGLRVVDGPRLPLGRWLDSLHGAEADATAPGLRCRSQLRPQRDERDPA